MDDNNPRADNNNPQGIPASITSFNTLKRVK